MGEEVDSLELLRPRFTVELAVIITFKIGSVTATSVDRFGCVDRFGYCREMCDLASSSELCDLASSSELWWLW